MNILETIYENKINFPLFFDRKIKITDNFTFLYGPKFCGKTSLIFDYLKNNSELKYLYIDLSDFRNTFDELINLQQFIDSNKIDILIIENYIEDFQLPKVNSILLSSLYFFNIPNFKPLKVMGLDFEEYLLFDTKHQNTTNSFNSFLKFGNIPEIIEYKDYKKIIRNKELIKLYETNTNTIEIIKLLIKSSGELKSPFWLYNILKKNMKISKDFFYKKIKELENNHTIIFCSKYNQPKAVKKIFSFNFALIDTITYKKNFANLFANMIFLELYNQNKEIFYLEHIDFYIPSDNTLIISMPFYNSSFLSKITPKVLQAIEELYINKISIITISNFDTIYIDTIEAQIIPFYEWALGK